MTSAEPPPGNEPLAAAVELLPALREFSAAVGRTPAGGEVRQWIGDLIRYHRIPHQARLLQRAAEKIRAIGIPTSAVDDRLLRAVLEEGSFDDDETMQERWSQLLVSAAFGTGVPPAFPEILRQMESVEALALDRIVQTRTPLVHGSGTPFEEIGAPPELLWRHLDNLERLQVINWKWRGRVDLPLPVSPSSSPPLDLVVHETQLGRTFVAACSSIDDLPPVEV